MSYIFERITQRLSAKKYNSLWIKRLRPTSEITRKLRLDEDDVRRDPEGHFFVLSGYNLITREITVSDPFLSNPYSHTLSYKVKVDRVICAILLGVLTFDANFLIIHPPAGVSELFQTLDARF